MAIEWNEENEKKLDELFAKFDTDNDGKIVFDDVKDYCLKESVQVFGHNPTDAEIKKYCDTMDRDGDGVITRDELKAFVEQLIAILGDPRTRLMAALNVMMKAMDKDENGLIDKTEFKTFMQDKGERPLTDAEIDDVFTAIDKDGDKETLTKDELLTLLCIGLAQKQAQT